MKNFFKKYSNKERQGSSTFEWTLTCPFAFILVMLCFYIMLMLFAWASYGSVASEIAKSLNIKYTALEQVNKWYETSTVKSEGYIMTGKTSYSSQDVSGAAASVAVPNTITMNSITVNNNQGNASLNESYKRAVAYHMLEHANQFYLPYTKFNNINVYFKQVKNNGKDVLDMTDTNNLSNYIVKVDINYNFFGLQYDVFGKKYSIPGPSMNATGYGIVI